MTAAQDMDGIAAAEGYEPFIVSGGHGVRRPRSGSFLSRPSLRLS
jgi:hypothetical protein